MMSSSWKSIAPQKMSSSSSITSGDEILISVSADDGSEENVWKDLNLPFYNCCKGTFHQDKCKTCNLKIGDNELAIGKRAEDKEKFKDFRHLDCMKGGSSLTPMAKKGVLQATDLEGFDDLDVIDTRIVEKWFADNKPKEKEKKARNPYQLFCASKREALKSENPEASMTDMSKILGDAWKQVNDEEKEVFQKLSAEEKVETASFMDSFLMSNSFLTMSLFTL